MEKSECLQGVKGRQDDENLLVELWTGLSGFMLTQAEPPVSVSVVDPSKSKTGQDF